MEATLKMTADNDFNHSHIDPHIGGRHKSAKLFVVVVGAHLLAYLLVWLTGTNQNLFYALNSFLSFLPDIFWQIITHFGETLSAIAILLLWVRQKPGIILHLLVSGLICFLLVYGLKQFLDVTRPHLVLAQDSFHFIQTDKTSPARPSGHTATGAFIAGSLFYLYRDRFGVCLLLVAGACLVGLSRIAIGVHWPLDIFLGGAIGWITGYLGYAWLTGKMRNYRGSIPKQTQHRLALSIIGLVLGLLVVIPYPYLQATLLFKLTLAAVLLWQAYHLNKSRTI